MNEILLISSGITVILCGVIVEALKIAFLPIKYAALASLAIGAIFGVLIGLFMPNIGDINWFVGLCGGIIAGESAAGLYKSGTQGKNAAKLVIAKFKKKE